MRVAGWAVVLSALAAPVQAGEFGLDVFDTQQLTAVSGRCGKGVVRIIGIESQAHHMRLDVDGTVFVRGQTSKGFKDLDMRSVGALSDHNEVRCLSTSTGNWLVVWSTCSGSACSDDGHYTVIDMDALEQVRPRGKNLCDASCASKVVGVDVSKALGVR